MSPEVGMEPSKQRRSVPATVGISFLIALVAGAMCFFMSLFFAIVVFLFLAAHRGGAQHVDFSETYRVIALPVGIGGLVVGFFWSLVDGLRRRARPATATADDN